MRKNSGFTAIELSVTLAIMVVVAALIMPPYLRWLRTYRLRGAVNNLIADVEMAKIRAIRENSFVSVLFHTEKYVVFVDNGEGTGGSAGDWIRNGDEALLRDRPLPVGVTFDLGGLTLADNRVRFNGRGCPPDVAGSETIPLINRSGGREIRMNRLGHMSMP